MLYTETITPAALELLTVDKEGAIKGKIHRYYFVAKKK